MILLYIHNDVYYIYKGIDILMLSIYFDALHISYSNVRVHKAFEYTLVDSSIIP